MACASLLYERELAEAEREFLFALELNPRYIQARDWYAFFYLQAAAGRFEEGVAQAKIALKSDPLSGYANALVGLTCFTAGKHAEAIQMFERALELDSDSFLARWLMHAALHQSGRFEEAVEKSEVALAMSGRHAWPMATLATTFADWGKPAEAEAICAELMARARRVYVPPVHLAIAASATGAEVEALRYAQQAFEIRDPSRDQLSRNWPYSIRLRSNPRFREILRAAAFE